MKSKRIKRVKRRTKKIKGGISKVKFDTMYAELQPSVKKAVHLNDITEYISEKNEESKIPYVVLSENIWGALIARFYDNDIYVLFGDSPVGELLSELIDYDNVGTLIQYQGKEDIPKDRFDAIYKELQPFVKNAIHLNDITEYISDKNEEHGNPDNPIPYLVLSDNEFCALIAKLYFDEIYVLFGDSPFGEALSKLINYDDENSLREYQVIRFEEDAFPRTRSLSVSKSYQGAERTCFAHAASLLIFHNIYQLPLTEEDKKMYLKNNCNLHLDTTKELEDFKILTMRCGDAGAIRILLFMYIYKVITKRFECKGNTAISILYYLKTPFQEIFTPKLNALLLPIFNSAPKDFSVSVIHLDEFKTHNYKSFLHEYLKKYYAGLRIKSDVSHAVAIIEINEDGILGKDSANGEIFFIPFKDFHSKSVFREKDYYSLEKLYFLYEQSNLKNFSVQLSTLLKNKEFKLIES